jgi:ADP-ribose pyrophosphatase YjhB (NUDIX family)
VPESFEAAAVRELAEETDLIVAVEDGHPVRDARGRQLRRAE